MNPRFRQAAAVGHALWEERERLKKRELLEQFWTDVFKAERWVQSALPPLIEQAAAIGSDRVRLYEDGDACHKSLSLPGIKSTQVLMQLLANGIAFVKTWSSESTSGMDVWIPIDQFLEE